MHKAIYLIGFCFLWATVGALNCNTGFEVQSNIITTQNWSNMDCPTNEPQSCLRSEGTIFIFGAYTVNITYGACASQTTCEQSCQRLVESTLVASFAAAAVIDQAILKYTLESCQLTCCNNDLCNQHSVNAIEEANQAMENIAPKMRDLTTALATTTTAPLSTTTESDILLCNEGFEVASQFLVSQSWNQTQCRRDLQQKCIRGEGKVVVSDLFELNVTTGFCANQSTCEDTCMGLFESVLVSLDQDSSLGFSISSCLSRCCDSDLCNGQSLAAMPTKRPTVSESTTTTTTTPLQPISTTSGAIGIASPSTLNCISGFDLSSSIVNEASWNLAGCPSEANQRCLRTEVNAVLFNEIEVSLSTGSCVDASVCELSCAELTRTIFFSDQPSSTNIQDLNIDSNDFNLTSCKFACCDTNNCNNNTVDAIDKEPTTVPVVDVSDPADPEPALECYSGYQAESIALNDRSWRLTQCSAGSNQRCIRAEGSAVVYGILDVNVVVGFCADISECDNRVCDDLDSYLLSGSASPFEGLDPDNNFVVNHCRTICCDENGCNNNSIPAPTLPIPDPTPDDNIDRHNSAEPSCSECTSCHSDTSCKDENSLFLLSLASRMNSLPARTASEVKIRIMELFHEAEFGNLVIR